MHTRFHDALADGAGVAESREMPNGVEIHARVCLLLIGQRRLDGILNVVAVEEIMDAQALLANRVEKRCRVALTDFADGGVAEHGVETTDARNELIGRTPAAGALDGFDRVANAVNGISNRVGKISIQEKELENPFDRDVGRIHLAIGFKRRAAAKQSHLLKIL